MDSPMDVAPDILRMLTPLNMNLFQSLAQITKGSEFQIGELGFKHLKDGGVEVTLGVSCELFLQYENSEEIETEIQAVVKDGKALSYSNPTEYVQIVIPFKLKK